MERINLSKYQKKLINSAYLFDFPIHKPYYELSEENKKLIWEEIRISQGLILLRKLKKRIIKFKTESYYQGTEEKLCVIYAKEQG